MATTFAVQPLDDGCSFRPSSVRGRVVSADTQRDGRGKALELPMPTYPTQSTAFKGLVASPDLNILNKAPKHMTPGACLQTTAQEVRRNDALRLLDMFKRNPAPPRSAWR